MATDKRDDPLAPKPTVGQPGPTAPAKPTGSPLTPERERSAGDVGLAPREVGTDKDPRANQEISDGKTEDEATVNVDLSLWNEKHPYPPQGPGSWMFKFGEADDEDAETRSYTSDYGFAQQQAAGEAREEGVETLTLDPGSPHG
jgi:hypothetical protein